MNDKLNIDFILEIKDMVNYSDPVSWFKRRPKISVNHKVNDIIIVIWGDPVADMEIPQILDKYLSPQMLLQNIQFESAQRSILRQSGFMESSHSMLSSLSVSSPLVAAGG